MRGRHKEAETNGDEASLRTLLRRLATDTAALVQAEMALAKLEVRETVRQAALDGAKIGAAVALAFVGALAIAAWAILALGDVLGGRHATAALIVGVVLVGVGAALAVAGRKGLQKARGPETAIASVQQDARMAKQQLRSFREELQRPAAEAAPRLPRTPATTDRA